MVAYIWTLQMKLCEAMKKSEAILIKNTKCMI